MPARVVASEEEGRPEHTCLLPIAEAFLYAVTQLEGPGWVQELCTWLCQIPVNCESIRFLLFGRDQVCGIVIAAGSKLRLFTQKLRFSGSTQWHPLL